MRNCAEHHKKDKNEIKEWIELWVSLYNKEQWVSLLITNKTAY